MRLGETGDTIGDHAVTVPSFKCEDHLESSLKDLHEKGNSIAFVRDSRYYSRIPVPDRCVQATGLTRSERSCYYLT